MGFRDHDFNLALLGRHIWNFVNNPMSLVVKVFMARYFMDNDVVQAGREGGVTTLFGPVFGK